MMGNRPCFFNVLVIDHTLPFFDQAAGWGRLFNILKMIISLGYRVTFLALEVKGCEAQYIPALEKAGIEVWVEKNARPSRWFSGSNCPTFKETTLKKLVTSQFFHLAYLHFFYTAEICLSVIRRYSPDTRIVIDTVDLAHLRQGRLALLTGNTALLDESKRTKEREKYIYSQADLLVAVTDREACLLEQLSGGQPVIVIPVVSQPWDNIEPFDSRGGLLFVGGFSHRPNVDAVVYFCRQIFPYILADLRKVKFLVVGNDPPPVIKALHGSMVEVTGYVPDLGPYFQRNRIFVAPIRYGAGIRGKIVEAMAAGLPVVANSLGAEGMGLAHGHNVLIADEPKQFANQVVVLYQDPVLWSQLSQNGREHVEQNYSLRVVKKAIQGLFEAIM